MSQLFNIPSVPAGSSALISQLHSQLKLNKDVQDTLAAKLSLILPHKSNNSVLIIGGKCGLTAQLLSPFCSNIDIVQQEPYLSLLNERFINNKDVKYTFTTQGNIGTEYTRPKPNSGNCKFNIYEMQKFDKLHQGQKSYNVILLQNVLINQKMNILQELLRIQHEVLITMIIPGKLAHENLFQLLAGIEQNILKIFYEHQLHQRLQNTKYITGRRKEQLFWQIFIWKKKPASEQGSMKIIHQIKQLLKKQIQNNVVQKKKIQTGFKTYQTKQLVDMYIDFHYNDQERFTVKNFPKTCGEKALEIAKKQNLKGRALDIGCATGRTSIVLAEHFDQVVGLDLSNAFIQAANQILHNNYSNLQSKVKFIVGDACKLEKSLGKFSLIFGGNLIDRLYDPEAFLIQVAQFLQKEGVLILTSPYSWLQQFTPKQKWIGGYYNKDNKPVHTQQGLNNILSQHGFKQLQQPEDIRFVIKQNNWVFQYTSANVTFWKKIQ